MKIHSQQLLVPVLFCLITFTFLGCNDEPSCPDEKESYLYMSDEYKKMLPYSGNDTFMYRAKNGDTVSAIGGSTQISFTVKNQRDPNPDCNVYNKVNYEVFTIDYSLFKIQRELQMDVCKVWYDNTEFKFAAWDVGSLGPDYTYYDSLYIGNKMYYRISQFISVDGSGTIYINRPYGILKIVTSNNEIIKLDRI